MKLLPLIIFFIIHINLAAETFINPLTDVCWECLFPITVSGVNVFPGEQDLSKHSTRVCTCPGVPPKAGIPLTYWEPLRMVDVYPSCIQANRSWWYSSRK